jgi:hypothetical protein
LFPGGLTTNVRYGVDADNTYKSATHQELIRSHSRVPPFQYGHDIEHQAT